MLANTTNIISILGCFDARIAFYLVAEVFDANKRATHRGRLLLHTWPKYMRLSGSYLLIHCRGLKHFIRRLDDHFTPGHFSRYLISRHEYTLFISVASILYTSIIRHGDVGDSRVVSEAVIAPIITCLSRREEDQVDIAMG